MRTYNDNFSEFLKVVKTEPIWVNDKLKNIYHELKNEEDTYVKVLLDIINGDLEPLDKTILTLSYLRDALKKGYTISKGSFKVIVYNYIEIAQMTGNVIIAKKTIEMANEWK